MVAGRPSCFRSVAGSGMPGVGVRPDLIPFFICSALGMPGVGVLPTGNTVPLAGMPGGILADGGSGLVESPGGIFAGSILIAMLALEFELEFAFDGTLDPQPAPAKTIIDPSKTAILLNILNSPL